MDERTQHTTERFEQLLALMDGDQELLQELIEVFLVDAPERMDAVRHAVEARDAEALYRAAHALKGSAGNFGAPAVVGRTQRMEGLAREADLDAAAAELELLATDLARLTDELAAVRNAA